MAPRIVVAAHGHCFDGIASAALFTHLRNKLDPRPRSFRYLSCGYGPKMQTVPERWLRGDENAIVDFRFTDSKRLHWYFDHHPTAFANKEQEAEALASAEGARIFFDANYDSCAKLIADVGKARFGVDFEQHADLIHWADRIDSASFSSAAEAIALATPVQRLAAVVERFGDADLYNEIAPRLARSDIADVAEHPKVSELCEQVATQRKAVMQRIDAMTGMVGNTAIADLSDAPLGGSGKFIAYALRPTCTYSAALMRMRKHYKLSVGFNPWSGATRQHDIAAICRRWGGGGHPVVGAASFRLEDRPKAQQALQTIATILNSDPAPLP